MPQEEMPHPVPSSVSVQPASVEVPVPPIVTAPQPPSQPITELPEELPAGRVLQIPSASMAQIRKAEREKGKAAHQRALDAQARELGFKSHEDMVAAAQRSRQRANGRSGERPQVRVPVKGASPSSAKPSAKPPREEPEPQATNEAPAPAGAELRMRRAEERREAALRASERQLAQERKRRKRAELDARAARAEAILRQEAVLAGVVDIDYALHLLRQRVARLDRAQLEKFSEKKFFNEILRASHPHLYGTPRTPATTGPSGAPSQGAAPAPSNSPTPPVGPSAQPTPPGSGAPKGARDARSITTEQMHSRLRELGLTPPGGSMPI